MPKQVRWSVAIDETAAGWNTLQWITHNVADGDVVRLVTVHERFGEATERSTGRLTIARHLLSERHPDSRIEQEVIDGPTVGRLLSETGEADALVIGGRRSDRVWASVTGRVAERVIAGVRNPVVVVPERWQPTPADSIVVGVEGHTATNALQFAAGRVGQRGGDLVLVRAWEPPTNVSPIGRVYLARDAPRWEHEGQLELDAAIRRVSRELPDLRVRAELRQGRPAAVLQRSGEATALIVIGRSHRSAVAGSLFGSVGEHLVHHSRVPVCVVPQQLDRPSADL
jgi:nucleotide-binding universal stress UspA family protein